MCHIHHIGMYISITVPNDYLSGERRKDHQMVLQSEITFTNKALGYAYNIGIQGRI